MTNCSVQHKSVFFIYLIADRMIIMFISVLCFMEMGTCSNDDIGDHVTLIKKVLKALPVQRCDSLVVSQLPFQSIGRSTLIFNNVGDLIGLMRDEEFVHTLSSMSCLILGSN